MESGVFNPNCRVEQAGMSGLGKVHYNLMEPALIEAALRRGEGELGIGGAFLCETGKHTGRSPKDKFVVREPSVEDTVWWEKNKPMDPAAFERLTAEMFAHNRGPEKCESSARPTARMLNAKHSMPFARRPRR